MRTFNRHRSIVALLAVLCIPFAVELDALLSLTLMAALTAGLIAFEAIHFREARGRLRATVH